MKPIKSLCVECGKERERLKVVSVEPDGTLIKVCPSCYKEYGYGMFLYEKDREV